MTFYADLPARRARQIAGDLGLILWSFVWIRIALWIHDLVMNLAAPGLAIADAGASFSDSVVAAGDSVGSLPLVGDALQSPFDGMGTAADAIASAGQAQADAVASLALGLSLVIGTLAIALYVAIWVPWRIAFIRRATAARLLVDANADLDLFALRAMTRQPLHVLARISDDPAEAWRQRDARIVRNLAALELKSEGLRLP